jgi:protein arginine kinase activator
MLESGDTMYCDECKSRLARVHYTQIVNGKRTEMHLCEECAQKKRELNIGFPLEPAFSFQNLLAGLIGHTSGSHKPVGISFVQDMRCNSCGLTYRSFAKIGKLGCSKCYESFGQNLAPVIRKIHGDSYHTGKIPRRTGGILHLRRERDSLKEELAKAISLEQYEKAAELRDRIRDMEKKLDSPSGN